MVTEVVDRQFAQHAMDQHVCTEDVDLHNI